MTLSLYMDAHVHSELTAALRSRGVDVLTAQDDGAMTLDDADLLDRATTLGRILVTYDRDFLAIAAQRLGQQVDFCSILRVSTPHGITKEIIDDVHLVVEAVAADEAMNRVFYVPF